jgi:hypothetical protein
MCENCPMAQLITEPGDPTVYCARQGWFVQRDTTCEIEGDDYVARRLVNLSA